MKYAPEKAAAEAELVKLNDALTEHYRENQKRVEAGEAIQDIPHDMYAEERRLERLINSFPPILEVGDGVSIHGYSDVHPYEVIKVNKSGKKVQIRTMKAELDPSWKPNFIPGGFSAHCDNQSEQKWIMESDEEGSVMEISLRNIKCDPKYNEGIERVSKWVPVGQAAELGKYPVSAGARKFHDYNF